MSMDKAIEILKKEGEERVLLVGSTVCIFAENVPLKVAEDVAACMRIMDMSSDSKFDKETQQRQWYNNYTKGLAQLGWTMTGAAHAEEAVDAENETLGSVAVKLVTREMGAGHRLSRCLNRSFTAIASAPQAQALFERSSTSVSGKSSTFQAVDCELSPQGMPIMHMKSFQITYDQSKAAEGGVLRKLASASTKVYRASQQGTFSLRQFETLRAKIAAKLENRADDVLGLD